MLDNVLYIEKGYINTEKVEELKNKVLIRDDLPEDVLSKIWQNYDFDKAEEKLLMMQRKLTMATFANDRSQIQYYQTKIVHSTEARMLAVRKVAEISKAKAGVDGITWRKMQIR